MFNYFATAEFIEDEGTYEINFSDFPDVQGIAYSKDNIELEAEETLTTAISDLIASKQLIPQPSAAPDNGFTVYLPTLSRLKIALNNAIIQTGTTKIDLARKLSLNAQQIERLLDLQYASKVESLEQALYLLGYEVVTLVNKREIG